MRNRLADVVRCRSKGQKRVGPFILEGLIHDAEVVLEQRRPMAIPAVGVRVCLQVAQQLVNQREMMAGHVTRQLCLDRLELHRGGCGHGRDGEIHATKLAPGLRSIPTHDPADQHHHEDDQRPHAHAANQPGPDSIYPGHHRLCGGRGGVRGIDVTPVRIPETTSLQPRLERFWPHGVEGHHASKAVEDRQGNDGSQESRAIAHQAHIMRSRRRIRR
ncbi:hypothetical protein [Vreelandella salicampi]|uniref:Uncharacterized protein n=1 Tax=Vreelandella salicampi TaxID=1449798 RepID=A0A7Z0LN31_9GAMM|nr:hypothetical protein [Halomonas salicampi]NYS61924.1 hypothetical protein [Halomonas salicampi]